MTPALVCSLTAESSSAAVAICVELLPICSISVCSLLRISCMACCSWPSSSRRSLCSVPLRSPEAMRWAKASVACSGAVIWRAISSAAAMPSRVAARPINSACRKAPRASLAALVCCTLNS
ncbi:hypothetical protein D3C77_618460 [compost metagenome]